MKELLLNAFERGEFVLHVQLVFDVHCQCLIGGEALARWLHPERGILPPGLFVPELTRLDLIDRLDFYMLELCCQNLAAWKGTQMGEFLLSCNFSRKTLAAPDFCSRLQAIVDRYSFDHTRLMLEITEDAILQDRARTLQNILFCKSMDFSIALDDLGAGYSSLSDLVDFPFNTVKIDRQIVKNAVTPKGATLLNGIVQLSHELGLPVLCEGAETGEELTAAFDSGCDYVQGFYFSKVYDLETAMQRYLAQTYE